MSTILDSGTQAINYARQTAKGTKGTAATTTVGYDRPKIREGGLGPNKTTASERAVDGQRFGSPVAFTDTAGGSVGSLTLQAQPENVGLYYAQILGNDTVTGSSDPWTHTSATTTTQGRYGTWWIKVGSAVGPSRIAYWDSKIAKLVMNVGKDQKIMHLALDIFALQIESFAVDPAKTEATTNPYTFLESEGAIEFDGAVIDSIEGEVVEIDTSPAAQYGNAITPYAVTEGEPFVSSTLSTVFTDVTLKKFNKAIFGEESPGAGIALTQTVIAAVVKSKYKRSASRAVTIERPKVPVDTSQLKTEAKVDGGPVPLALTGHCEKGGSGEAMLTVVTLSGEENAYA